MIRQYTRGDLLTPQIVAGASGQVPARKRADPSSPGIRQSPETQPAASKSHDDALDADVERAFLCGCEVACARTAPDELGASQCDFLH